MTWWRATLRLITLMLAAGTRRGPQARNRGHRSSAGKVRLSSLAACPGVPSPLSIRFAGVGALASVVGWRMQLDDHRNPQQGADRHIYRPVPHLTSHTFLQLMGAAISVNL